MVNTAVTQNTNSVFCILYSMYQLCNLSCIIGLIKFCVDNYLHVQWNLSIPAMLETNESCWNSEVTGLQVECNRWVNQSMCV